MIPYCLLLFKITLADRLDLDIANCLQTVNLAFTTPCRALREAYEEPRSSCAGGNRKRKQPPVQSPFEQAMKYYKEGGYLAINLFCRDNAPPTIEALQAFRLSYHEQEWGWGHGREINDPFQSTLVLLGLPGTFSGFHVDWSEAFNIALLLAEVRLI